jgi:hypothetical protein
MKTKRLIRTGRVTLMEENGNAYMFVVKNRRKETTEKSLL